MQQLCAAWIMSLGQRQGYKGDSIDMRMPHTFESEVARVKVAARTSAASTAIPLCICSNTKNVAVAVDVILCSTLWRAAW